MSLLNLQSSAGQNPRGKKSLKMWMGAGLVVAVLGIGSTFAASININQGPETEFGQGVTKTVFCGGETTPITVSPISKFVNERPGSLRLAAAAIQGQSEVSFDFKYATAVYSTSSTNSSSDFIVSNVQPKTVNTKTGVWLTKIGNGNDVRVADNQNELTFDKSQQDTYVFSQNVVSRRNGGSSNVNGYWKVRDTSVNGKIVISAAITQRAAVYSAGDPIPPAWYFKGVVISGLPTSCQNIDFIISGYGLRDGAKTLIEVDNDDVDEITALWTGSENGSEPLVSKSRISFTGNDIRCNVTATQDLDSLEILFNSPYLETKDLARLVIETQQNTLVGGPAGDCNNGDEEDDEDQQIKADHTYIKIRSGHQ